MKIVYFGTPDIAVSPLRFLASNADHDVQAVFTQPPARRSRRGKAVGSPVANAASELGIETHEVHSVNEDQPYERLQELSPDIIVVVAFGQILKKRVLNLPKHGCINFHPSLLPAYRGAAPIQRAIMDGLETTGLTVMRLIKKLDAGAILVQEPWRWDMSKDAEELMLDAGEKAGPMLSEALSMLEDGQLGQEQDHEAATYAHMLEREDGEVNFSMTAVELVNRVRAVQPWPKASTEFLSESGSKRVMIRRAEIVDAKGAAGDVLEVNKSGIVVATADAAVLLTELQLEGKP
ncbi:MAG: methionyl-tRNA formyltransferase, partial [Planctomycetota bacterium]